jgi:hypothetical protein
VVKWIDSNKKTMRIVELVLQILTFGFALWLGLYLISRNLADARLRYSGLGLVAYAIGLSLDILGSYAASDELASSLATWQRPFTFLPAVFWLALLVQLIPADSSFRERLRRHPRPFGVVAVASLFFALGLGFMFYPFDWLPRFWVLIGLGVDLVLLGLAIAVLDAFDEGEALLPHFWRSLDYAFLTALLFGGQVALAMAFSTGVTLPMLILLLTTIAAAILIQTFSDTVQSVLDGFVFLNYPRMRQTRERLFKAASAASRIDDSLDIDVVDDAEFARLTRRALGHMGNLPKLAASPLTGMRLVEHRLSESGKATGTLERAGELKAILSESIERLKPRAQEEFGTADEWRYYNALFFPYVLGLKPYSRRLGQVELADGARKALDWFRTEIPQRTLYNWQNAAAELVAQDLRERTKVLR